MLAEQLRGVRVELTLAVRDDGRLPTLDDVEQGRTDESPGLASAGSAEHGNVPVEPSVRGEAHGFAVALAQEDSFRFGQGLYLQHIFQLFFPHPGGGAVGALLADGEAPGVLAAAAEPVAEFEVGGECPSDQKQNAHGFQPGEGEEGTYAICDARAGQLDFLLPGYTAGLLPGRVVFQQLAQKAA